MLLYTESNTYYNFSELTTELAVPEYETTEIPDLSDDYDSNNFDIGRTQSGRPINISRPPIDDISRPIDDINRPIDDDFPDDDTDTNCTYDQYECKNGICIATQKICDGQKGRLHL